MKILAIDPGAKLGWATNATSGLEWGEHDFSLRRVDTEGLRWLRFEQWFEALPRPDLIVYEEQTNFGRTNPGAGEIGRIMTAMLLKSCEKWGFAAQAVSLQKIKAFAIPALPRPKKGEPKNPLLDRSKDAMIRTALARLNGELVSMDMMIKMAPIRANSLRMSEHEADALWLYWYAQHHFATKEVA